MSKTPAPGFVIQDVPGVNAEMVSKIKIDSVNDFDRLKSLILRCYEIEAGKH
ncbi:MULTISPECIES: hypothetical protein [Nostoc]|uniref:Uncharacterized protein n=1 Tax=Nostoc paludosum FACHB-159 TaxID=2692908 RepID=A0ABR8KK88_9NOSO|nr:MULTISPECIES: hypothetical protein [Nostoc]MBD2682218.1 hypothetical protein [Nostoc sp. FACHB-857]MBD2738548.1 hypothetical protein [Nostoc paludosum FACHB-159]